MRYLYEACDYISDLCHQQLLRKMRRKISWDVRKDRRKDRGKTVSPLRWSGGIHIRLPYIRCRYILNLNTKGLPAVNQKWTTFCLVVVCCHMSMKQYQIKWIRCSMIWPSCKVVLGYNSLLFCLDVSRLNVNNRIVILQNQLIEATVWIQL